MKNFTVALFIMIPFFVNAQKKYEEVIGRPFTVKSIDISTSASNANIYNERGLMKEREGDLEGALELYAKANDMAPKVTAYMFNRGITLQKLERHTEAIIFLTELTELDNTDFEAFIALGISLGKTGKLEEAIEALDRAELLRPSYRKIYYQRGTFLNLFGDYERAQKDLDIAVEREPDFAKAWYNRGINTKDMGNFKRAILDFDKAISLEPYNAESYLARGVSYLNIEKKKQAAEDLKRAAELGNNEAAKLYYKYFNE